MQRIALQLQTHGWYDFIHAIFGAQGSILPMNINVEYWGNEFGTREQLGDPYTNISAGADMLDKIISNLPDNPPISQIATLYNKLSETTMTNYGARAEEIHTTQPWKNLGLDADVP